MALEIDYPRAVLVVLGIVSLLAIGVAAGTSTASFGVYNLAWDGASDLQTVAEDQGLTGEIATNTTAYETVDPGRSVALVLSPTEAYGPTGVERLRTFVESGGTLVVAEDFNPHSNELLASLGVSARVDGRLIRDERHNYQSPAMPTVTNVAGESVTQGVEELTLNHGTTVRPGNATVLASTSEYAYLDDDLDGKLDESETLDSYPVATTETVGEGRVIVVGDPSIFINVMLDRPGNRQFVGQVFRSAGGGPSGGTVILDYSHAGAIPPLMFLVLALRDSILLQLVVGFGGLGLLGVAARWPNVLDSLLADGRQRAGGQAGFEHLDREELTSQIRDSHPDWDPDRVERVVRAIIRRRHEPGDDD